MPGAVPDPLRAVDDAVAPVERHTLWHVTITVAGDALALDDVAEGLRRLSHERPFLLSARYGADRAEVRYWEEASCLDDAAALGLRLWGEHRTSAGLPDWRVVGLEVVERETFHWRAATAPVPVLVPAGDIRPF
ncbi:MAG TPA: hypothetical protein VFS29_10690 [Motilibacteraceae bacterium]|nr:hypothetical protein [Motilibacteraceae bacterium]